MANQVMLMTYVQDTVSPETLDFVRGQLGPLGIEFVSVPYSKGKSELTSEPFVKTFDVEESPSYQKGIKEFRQHPFGTAIEVENRLRGMTFSLDEARHLHVLISQATVPTQKDEAIAVPGEVSVLPEALPVRSRKTFFDHRKKEREGFNVTNCPKCCGKGRVRKLGNTNVEYIPCGTCNGTGKVEVVGDVDLGNAGQKGFQGAVSDSVSKESK